MLLKLESFKYATSLDLNMGYYHIHLSNEFSNLSRIILSWEKYMYKYLPIGIRNSPDIFQDKMNKIFHRFEFIWSYIDGMLIFNKGDWSSHMDKM